MIRSVQTPARTSSIKVSKTSSTQSLLPVNHPAELKMDLLIILLFFSMLVISPFYIDIPVFYT
jgi:hypothetical protein